MHSYQANSICKANFPFNPLSAICFHRNRPVSVPPVLCTTIQPSDTQGSLLHENTALTDQTTEAT